MSDFVRYQKRMGKIVWPTNIFLIPFHSTVQYDIYNYFALSVCETLQVSECSWGFFSLSHKTV